MRGMNNLLLNMEQNKLAKKYELVHKRTVCRALPMEKKIRMKSIADRLPEPAKEVIRYAENRTKKMKIEDIRRYIEMNIKDVTDVTASRIYEVMTDLPHQQKKMTAVLG